MELGCVENAAYDHINAAGLQKALQTMAPGDPLKGVARMYVVICGIGHDR